MAEESKVEATVYEVSKPTDLPPDVVVKNAGKSNEHLWNEAENGPAIVGFDANPVKLKNVPAPPQTT